MELVRAKEAKEAARDELLVAQRAHAQRTLDEVGKLKQEYDFHLESKHIKPETEVTLFQTEQFYDPNKSQRRNCENFILKPEPIMALDRILGVHPRHNSACVFYNKDDKLSSELLYS